MTKHIVLLAALLAACKDNPTEVVDPTDPPPPVTPVPCDGWEQALVDGDLASAHTAFEACLTANPDDSTAHMGRGLTALGLIYDSPPVRQILTTCGESPELYEPIFGDDGVLAAYEEGMAGTATLSTADRQVDGNTTGSGFLQSIGYVYTSPSWNVTIADSFRQRESLTIGLGETLYRFSDSTSVPVTVGMVVDVTAYDVWVSAYRPCDDDPDHCYGYDMPGQLAGTLTITDIPSVGGTLAFDFDLHVPRYCDACTSSELHLVGSVADDVTDLEQLAYDFPFVEAVEASPCLSGSDCDYRTEVLSVIADICPAGTQDLAWSQARVLRDLFASIGDDFEAAGADPDLAFSWPSDAWFFIDHDLAFGQTDALALAALSRGMAASITLGTSYDVIAPTTTLGSRTSAYTGPDWDWDLETCALDHAYWGIPVGDLVAELDTHAGALRADADMDRLRAELLAAFQDLRAAGAAVPTSPGFLDFSQTPSWTASIDSDIGVVIASLQGTDGTLLTAPVYEITLDAFLNDPTSRTDALASLGVASLFTTGTDENTCEVEIVGADGVPGWLAAENGAFPVTEEIVDAGVVPGWAQEGAIESILDADDIPLFMGPTARTLIEDGTL
ncbi:MAG: hypothetical protein KC656_20735 [Myxococcales bacterium]|nr:hypothetical protein [Myxococcales bacterium]